MLSYQMITDTSEWEKLKPEWDKLLAGCSNRAPFIEYDFQRLWWETYGGGEWEKGDLVIITARENGRLIGIAPFFRSHHPDGTNNLMFIGSYEISDYLDFIAGEADLERFVDGLLQYLSTGDVSFQRIDLYNLLDTSQSIPVLELVSAKLGWQLERSELQKAPSIPLPGDWETYLAGIDKKQRHEIRRKMRRLEESGHPSRWYTVQSAMELDGEITAFFELMKQAEDKRKFLTTSMQDMMRKTMHCAFNTGCLHLAFLEIDGIKAAGYFSFLYNDRLWVYNSGLNYGMFEFSPGWVLLGYLLQWANNTGIKEFDFMRGDEDYKYKFGAVDRSVVRLQLSR